jgi:hypothetical protein
MNAVKRHGWWVFLVASYAAVFAASGVGLYTAYGQRREPVTDPGVKRVVGPGDGLIAVSAEAPKEPVVRDVVEAKKFVLRDDAGKVRATLSMEGGGPSLRLYDENERRRAVVAVGKMRDGKSYGPVVGVFGEDGKLSMQMSVVNSVPMLFIRDADDKLRAFFNVYEGRPGISLLGDDEKSRITMIADKETPTLALLGGNGKPRISLTAGKSVGVSVNGGDGIPRGVLGVEDDYPLLYLLDKDRNRLFRKP